jgi:hypothetical protein
MESLSHRDNHRQCRLKALQRRNQRRLRLLDEQTAQTRTSHSRQLPLLRRSPSISAHKILPHCCPHRSHQHEVSQLRRRRVQQDKRRRLHPYHWLGDKVNSKLRLPATDREAVRISPYPPNTQSTPYKAQFQVMSTHCLEQNHHRLHHLHGTAHDSPT